MRSSLLAAAAFATLCQNASSYDEIADLYGEADRSPDPQCGWDDIFGPPKNEPGYPKSVKVKDLIKPYTDKKNYKLHAQQVTVKAHAKNHSRYNKKLLPETKKKFLMQW